MADSALEPDVRVRVRTTGKARVRVMVRVRVRNSVSPVDSRTGEGESWHGLPLPPVTRERIWTQACCPPLMASLRGVFEARFLFQYRQRLGFSAFRIVSIVWRLYVWLLLVALLEGHSLN